MNYLQLALGRNSGVKIPDKIKEIINILKGKPNKSVAKLWNELAELQNRMVDQKKICKRNDCKLGLYL